MRQERSRNICFTSFLDEKVEFDETIMKYMIIGSETCPDTGKHHWQGYIQFKEQVHKKDMAEILGSKKIHWDTAMGNAEENYKYCSKDGDYEEFGSMKKQGERTDLMAVAELIKDGKNLLEIVLERPVEYIKFHRGIEKAIQLREKAVRWYPRDVEVYVLIGPTGCGKTSLAYKNDPGLYKLLCEENRPLWFDGYDGEKTLLIDEMGPDCIPYSFMLGMLDSYELRLPIKGGFTYANWTRVFITSNKSMENWWHGKDISALKRRITRCKIFADPRKVDTCEKLTVLNQSSATANPPPEDSQSLSPRAGSEADVKNLPEVSEMEHKGSTQKWAGNTKQPTKKKKETKEEKIKRLYHLLGDSRKPET